LDLESIPKELLVIGGGYIGLEMGSVYAALGSMVTVVEMMDSILDTVDKDFSKILHKKLANEFKEILLGTKVLEVKSTKKGIKVQFENRDGKFEHEYDKVLVSVGRKPNSEKIDLENTKVVVNKRGFIEIDQQRRTNDPNIFAIGDVAGDPMLAHKATHEGRVVAEIIAGEDIAYDAATVPAVIYTDPEIAWCGLTEQEAKDKNIDIKVTKFPWGASGRAITLDRTDGLTKLVFETKTERILGVGLVGPGAGELISEGVLAVEMAARASDIALSIHPHPTLTETFMEAAEMFFGNSTHVIRSKRK
jgi:dihydrolipoamide dehydrogenase